MTIKSIELSNYRNYNSLLVEFDKKTNILYGDNAQGKTNILESIYLCGTTKSHRGSKDREMIQLEKEESHIRMMIEKNEIIHKIDMHLKKNKSKGVAIDGIPIRKSSELLGFVSIVFFSPEDLSIIKDGPGARRRFLDIELCQLDRIYMNDLTKYNKIVIQRNNLLKQIGFNKELMGTLQIWDDQLIEYGIKIIKRRAVFVDELNEILFSIHKRLSGGKEDLKIEYEPNTEENNFKQKVMKARERDLFQKMTTVGPHRDDINFLIHQIDIRKYGSQGQQRTSALSLKLAEIQLVKASIHDSPILLLDDVLSELDRNRQNHLLDSIHDIQTIVTCTGLEEFILDRLKVNRIYKVCEGNVNQA